MRQLLMRAADADADAVAVYQASNELCKSKSPNFKGSDKCMRYSYPMPHSLL